MTGYGLTESVSAAISQKADDVVLGSVGIIVPNLQATIIDPETMKSLPAGQVGELWMKGPSIMKGYWHRPDATASTIVQGGWLRTGDMAKITSDGHFWIIDRLKELIKYKGLQVAPAELEETLITHPEILDAAVLGIPDEAAGELPRAYVMLKPESKLTEEDVKKYVAQKLAPHKQLRGGVIFTQAIPKSASGKILRRVLKEQDAAARKAQQAKL